MKTSDYFAAHGAVFDPQELKNIHFKFVEEETAATKRAHPEYEFVDIKIDKVYKRLYALRGIDASDELIAETARFFRISSREYIKLYDGVAELLTELKKRAKVYLLTNAQRLFTWDEIVLVGVHKIFDGIIISSDEECKPDSHFYRMLFDRYNIDPKESIMVGNDPVADIKGAQLVGLDTLYIHTNISPEIDMTTGCTYFIPDGDSRKMKDYLL